jgi:hypothetical protein
VVCPVEAILVGDLNDPTRRWRRSSGAIRCRCAGRRRTPSPKLFYKGAHQSTLDPLAASAPTGDIFAWAQQPPRTPTDQLGVAAGAGNTSSAAAILAYDVGHTVPWDWRVGLYTWTKSIAAGVYAGARRWCCSGCSPPTRVLWRWVAPVGSGAFLAVTGAVLVWDLEHPERFYYIFTRPQWRQLAGARRGDPGAYGAVLALHLLAACSVARPARWLAVLGSRWR